MNGKTAWKNGHRQTCAKETAAQRGSETLAWGGSRASARTSLRDSSIKKREISEEMPAPQDEKKERIPGAIQKKSYR